MSRIFIYPFTEIVNETVRPLIPLIIENPFTKQQKGIMALLDTGADTCLFPAWIPNNTGHNLKHPDVQTSINTGIEGNQMSTWKHTFKIYLLEYRKTNIVWETKDTLINCVDHDNIPPLLGYSGFLQYLNIGFNYKTNRITIEI